MALENININIKKYINISSNNNNNKKLKNFSFLEDIYIYYIITLIK